MIEDLTGRCSLAIPTRPGGIVLPEFFLSDVFGQAIDECRRPP